jgi:DinB family protein
MKRDEALADFDRARDEWEAAFARVPDAALGFLKSGDDYSLGGLMAHVNWVLVHYGRVLDAILAGDFKAIGPQDPPGAEAEAREAARRGLSGAAERGRSLAQMAALHEAARSAMSFLDVADWDRKCPVVYAPGDEPYKTSPQDVAGWLSDHYREHVTQTAELIEAWKASKAAG